MKYKVQTKFVFNGIFTIEAENKEQAREYIDKHCGLVIGGDIHSTLPDDMVDWDFPIHPETLTGKVTLIRSKRYE
jgi:hypothetical protein